jgi:ribonucleoside-diphosphate reductase beta chain
MKNVKLPPLNGGNIKNNPIPWIDTWLKGDTVQVAPQETEITSYLVGQIDSSVNLDGFSGMEL